MRKLARRTVRALAFIVCAVLSLASARAEEPESRAASWLKQLKTLEGEWKGTTPSGKPVTLSYQNIAGGTAVMEIFSYGDKTNAKSMYTIYHLDGDNLMLTHYCISNNQPRMRAEFSANEPNVLRFSFVDGTNIEASKAGHMHKAMLRLIDQKHIANEWTYKTGDQNAFVEGAEYERLK